LGVIFGVLLVLFVVAFKLFLDFPSRFAEITSRSSAFASSGGLGGSGGSGGGNKFSSGGSVGSGGSIKYSDLVKEIKEASGGSGGSSEVPSFCFDEAGRYYEISPLLLRAIAQVESGLNPKAYRANPDGSASIGLMQVNTKWLSDLRRAGYDESLFWDVCYNVWLGAWVLKSCIQRYGYGWRAVDCYRGVPNPSGNSAYVWAVYRVLRQSLEAEKKDAGVKFPSGGFKFAGMP
jgi:hypothetical protein